MEREKRQIKVPEPYIIPKVCYPRKRKKKLKKKPSEEARYEIIPFPLKFIYTNHAYGLYGDIGLREYRGTLVTETGAMNLFLNCRGVEIIKEKHFNRIFLCVERKFKDMPLAWQHIVEGLIRSESSEMQKWGERIKQFALKHEAVTRQLANEDINFNDVSFEMKQRINESTIKKVAKLFETYPCITFTSTQGKNFAKIKEFLFNDAYLQELGFTMESFATYVLQEGIPRMMPYDTSYCAKLLIESYFTLGVNGVETPEITSEIWLKNGYTRRVRFKMFYFASYTDTSYDVKAVLIILGKEKEITKNETNADCPVNQNFLKKIISKEKDINRFMKRFYDTNLNLPYTSSHKVCRVRELDVKNDEDDYADWEEEFEQDEIKISPSC